MRCQQILRKRRSKDCFDDSSIESNFLMSLEVWVISWKVTFFHHEKEHSGNHLRETHSPFSKKCNEKDPKQIGPVQSLIFEANFAIGYGYPGKKRKRKNKMVKYSNLLVWTFGFTGLCIHSSKLKRSQIRFKVGSQLLVFLQLFNFPRPWRCANFLFYFGKLVLLQEKYLLILIVESD